MEISLYVRSFPVGPSPILFSLTPFPEGSVHYLLTPNGERHQEQLATLRVTVPDGSKIGTDDTTGEAVLVVIRDGRPLNHSATAVYALSQMGAFGFALVK